MGYFAAILKTAGTQTIAATDAANSTLTGTSNPITVSAAGAARFSVTNGLLSFPGVLSGPQNFAVTGTPLGFTVTALDAFGNVAPTYAGVVHFTSSDSGAALPANSTLVSGVGGFSATLATAGTQTLTATDTVQNSGFNAITGTTGGIVTRGLVVTSFTPTAGGFTITFDKPFNPSTVNLFTTTGLPNDVLLATTNTQVSLRGSLVFNPPTNVGGSPTGFTFVKTASVTATGTFNPSSGLLAAGKYTLTLRSYNAGSSGFQDAIGGALDGTNSGTNGTNFQITFSVSAPPVAVGIPGFARGPSNTDAIFLPSTLSNGSTFALSYTNPAANPTTGTATITFSTTGATLQSNIQTALTIGGLVKQVGTNPAAQNTPNSVVVVTNDSAAGANVLVTFQSALALATNQLLFTSTPGIAIALANINVANNIPTSGIPIALTSALGVTSGTFTLQYNPTLLNITAVAPSAALANIAGASFFVVSNTVVGSSGTLVLSLLSPTRLSTASTAFTLGSLLATVPLSATASYGAKQLLHFSSELLNGTAGPIAIAGVDGVQVVAYLGDVTDTGGPLSLQDATAISVVGSGVPNTAAQTIPGFTAFPNLDPILIGDVSLQGIVNQTDAGTMTQQVGGTARPTIPYAPIGLPVTPVGPDPTLTVGGGSWTVQGDTLVVPVSIDTARPQGSSGMNDAMLALTFDPTIFDVSAADVQLGTVPEAGSGWQIKTEVNAQTGLIGLELYSATPIVSPAGGSLVTIALHPRAGAATLAAATPPLTLVPYVDPSGGSRVYQTQVSDGQGAFVVHFQPNFEPAIVEMPSSLAENELPLSAVEVVVPAAAHNSITDFIQSGEIIVAFSNVQMSSDVRDLIQLQQAKEAEESTASWEVWLAYSHQTTGLGVLDEVTDQLDEEALLPETPDPVQQGSKPYFAPRL